MPFCVGQRNDLQTARSFLLSIFQIKPLSGGNEEFAFDTLFAFVASVI